MTTDDGFPERTDFEGDALACDPSGCGCMDCIVGASVPLDSPRMHELAKAVANGRRFVNRSGEHLALVERYDGTVEFVELPRAQVILGVFPDL